MCKYEHRRSSVRYALIAGGEARRNLWTAVEEGAHGGTMGSPMQDV